MAQRYAKDFVGEVRRSLERIGVPRDASVLVALSGGPDSVALLYALVEALGHQRISAAHLNHALRGGDADHDEGFCRELCRQLNVNFVAEKASGLSADMPNLEEAARRVRYDFLNRVADRIGANYICLGHHADDQAETVLMRLLRGAGIAGLSAMAEVGPGRIIRPMLSITRPEILRYLDAIGAKFVNDASNLSPAMLRNRIRGDLLPSLDRDYVPGASRRLAALAAEMRSVDAFVSRAAAHELATMSTGGGELNLARFSNLDPALRAPVLRLYLANQIGNLRRIDRDHLIALVRLCADGPVNGEISLPGGWRATREYDRLRIEKNGANAEPRPRFSVPLALEGTTEILAAGFAFDATVMGAADIAMPSSNSTAVFDLRAVSEHGLIARNYLPGDRVRPLGLDGTRKVKEVFIDRKLPPSERSRFPVVTLGAEEIVWLPGLLRCCGALVSKSTETVVRVEARYISSN